MSSVMPLEALPFITSLEDSTDTAFLAREAATDMANESLRAAKAMVRSTSSDTSRMTRRARVRAAEAAEDVEAAMAAGLIAEGALAAQARAIVTMRVDGTPCPVTASIVADTHSAASAMVLATALAAQLASARMAEATEAAADADRGVATATAAEAAAVAEVLVIVALAVAARPGADILPVPELTLVVVPEAGEVATGLVPAQRRAWDNPVRAIPTDALPVLPTNALPVLPPNALPVLPPSEALPVRPPVNAVPPFKFKTASSALEAAVAAVALRQQEPAVVAPLGGHAGAAARLLSRTAAGDGHYGAAQGHALLAIADQLTRIADALGDQS